MKNLKMWLKLSVGMGAVLVLVLVIGTISFQSLRTIQREVGALGYAYAPLQFRTMSVLSSMLAVPANMNAYLYSRSPEAWKKTEHSLDNTRQAIDELNQFIDASTVIVNTGRGAKVNEAFEAMSQAVLAMYAKNEAFKKQQQDLLQLGAEISRYTGEFLTFQLNHVSRGVKEGASNAPSRVEVLRKVYALVTLVSDIRSGMLQSLAEEDKSYCQANLAELIPTAIKKATELKEFVITTEGKEFGGALARDLARFRDMQETLMALWEQTDTLYAASDEARGTAVNLASQIVKVSRDQQEGSMEKVESSVLTSSRQVVAGSAIAVLLGILIAFVITRSVTGPLGRAVSFARAVAGGELGRRLGMRQKDEIGQLSDALDTMVNSLNAKISEAETQSAQALAKEEEAQSALARAEEAGREAQAKSAAMLTAADKLEGVAHVVSSASTQLLNQIEQSGQGATEQADRMTQTAAAMEEMNSTVLEVAKNANQAAEASASTRHKAEDGSAVVQQAVAGIRKVRQESLVLKEDMGALAGQAQAISRIMAVISDIADQTNLLALNAAIEAARAGDAGRGFAVVADSVRTLAEKTMTSTTDVGNAIKAIQDSVAKSMNQVDMAVREIEAATDLANRSDAALREIVTMVDGTADQVRAIAAASEQQSAASEEITSSIGEVNTIAGSTAQTMEDASKAVSELARQAQHLTGLIDDMKRG